MISSWWDLILTALIFISGIGLGKLRSVNEDITKQTSYMQDLIDEAYEKRDHMKRMWLDAEEKAESWERRYYNLIEDIYAEEESEVGS
jgi:hypothetical protein